MGTEAWGLAEEAARAAGVGVRALSDIGDTDRILDVMIATWGRHQLIPREMLRAFQGSGNVPYGAFRGDDMVGYVLGWMGDDPEDGVHVHSHMLAVVPAMREGGVGYALKLAQRAAALDAGTRVVRWTFDPMQSKNAHFNINKLGTVADRFHRHYYGDMTDVLNAGERTDRLEARWDLGRAPGPRRPATGPGPTILRNIGGHPHGARCWDGPSARVETVGDYPVLRESDRALAAAWRDAVAEALESCRARGMVVVGFDSGDREVPAYVLAGPEVA